MNISDKINLLLGCFNEEIKKTILQKQNEFESILAKKMNELDLEAQQYVRNELEDKNLKILT